MIIIIIVIIIILRYNLQECNTDMNSLFLLLFFLIMQDTKLFFVVVVVVLFCCCFVLFCFVFFGKEKHVLFNIYEYVIKEVARITEYPFMQKVHSKTHT